ncbi:thiolase family protein [Halioxenophilus aromaticivorans]|uniref:Thiolase family protein n=1 Tax=Halioxenophilus aromaticivorans TaxID=1306992 RepID=A0AAV3TXU3_9ALTE
MLQAVVSGLGEVHPQRKSGKNVETLILESIGKALEDAGITAKEIGAVVTESSLIPEMAPFDRIAPAAGLNNVNLTLQTVPVGAGILSSFAVAYDLVAQGKADHALMYFGVDWGTNPAGPSGYHAGMLAKKIIEGPTGFAGPPLYFACAARRYQHVYGLSDEELQDMLWQVVEFTRVNACQNPHAQQGHQLTKEQYLAKTVIAEPLRSVDCSLLSDGAVAVVISRAGEFKGRSPAVTLAGWGYEFDPIPDMDFYTQSPWLPDLPACRRATNKALSLAKLRLDDVDLFQIYDCFSIAVILQIEAMGLCPPGQGRHLIKDDNTLFNGRVPVNTHGGLLAHGYLLGVGHLAEAVHQLRGQAGNRQVENAKAAFVGAGPGRQYTSLILRRANLL